jgi:hypothetical protein
MGTNVRQNIVTNGLAVHLDAGSRISYPGSGTTWIDLSGNRYNGTLTNTPTFDSRNQGSLTFNGTNQYVTGSSNTTLDLSTNQNYSICAWINPNFADSAAGAYAVFNYTGPSPGFIRTYIRWEGTSLGFYTDTVNSVGSAWRFKPSFAANTWNYLCFTHTTANVGLYYFNGSPFSTVFVASSAATGVVNFPVTVGYGSVNNYYWNGRIATTSVYNRTLSAQEIAQNYNATKTRYGLT